MNAPGVETGAHVLSQTSTFPFAKSAAYSVL